MFKSIDDFLRLWKEESSMTLLILNAMDDSLKSKKINENVRSAERLSWHIVQTLSEMPHKAGLIAEDSLEHKPLPETFKEIVSAYEQYAAIIATAVKEKWNDAGLNDTINMYGEEWSKGKILAVLILHQTHHRGQLTVIMRMLGMKVPGTYGPSKEEWTKYGMPVME